MQFGFESGQLGPRAQEMDPGSITGKSLSRTRRSGTQGLGGDRLAPPQVLIGSRGSDSAHQPRAELSASRALNFLPGAVINY